MAVAAIAARRPDGGVIAMEQREGRERVHMSSQAIASDTIATCNPVFNRIAASSINALMTDAGVITQANTDAYARALVHLDMVKSIRQSAGMRKKMIGQYA